ncbi:MAG: SDR family NAD(P)-dependent oxidoreductase, partial [Gemmataceae bacterium]
MVSHVQQQVARVLGLPAGQLPDLKKGFFELGMDSLMAVELRNRLQKELGTPLHATLVFDYPNVEALANYLVDWLQESSPEVVQQPAPSPGPFAREPIAIVGLSCRFPGGARPEEFWQLLREGREAIREIPPERWDREAFYDPDPEAPGKMYVCRAGLLEHIDRFDAAFFGIAPREAVGLDPQQRLLLEVAWEALENAGLAGDSAAQKRTGVYVGISGSDYAALLAHRGVQAIDAYVGTGTAPAVAAGRLNYVLGLQGPSVAIDTACSSSLVAVSHACDALRSGRCDTALAGGVHAIVTPEAMIVECKARMLSPEGRCKTFDAAADGFVRGEGCGVVVLKRLSDAERDGDRILALIRGCAVNQDGRSSGLTVPNGLAQQDVLREALADAGVQPHHIDYVEAHGTGTSLGDPIEVQALGAALGKGRKQPLLVGSVKTNIGHLEAAAGIAGLIKVVLALEHEEIPGHLHLHTPNPLIPWQSLPVRVAKETTAWPRGMARRIAGVSSFGFSGTNAHLVVEEAPERQEQPAEVDRPLHVLALSARTAGALAELTEEYAGRLSRGSSLADVAYTACSGRAHFEHRLAVVTATAQQAKRTLLENAHGSAGLHRGQVPGQRVQLAWLFPEKVARGVGRQLFETQPTFRRTIDHCAELLHRPVEELFEGQGQDGPAQFTLQYALAILWQSWGVHADILLGYGVGEYVAAAIAGVYSLEDGLRLAVTHHDCAEFEQSARAIDYGRPQRRLLSPRRERVFEANETPDADYWLERHHGAQGSTEGTALLAAQGYQAILAMGTAPAGTEVIASLDEDQNVWDVLLNGVAKLYVAGLPIDWAGFDRDYPRRKVSLPTYPFERQRFWVEEARATPAAAAVELLYEIDWRSVPATPHATSSASFLILANASELGAELARLLQERGQGFVLEDARAVPWSSPDGVAARLEQACTRLPCTDVVFLAGLDGDAGEGRAAAAERWTVALLHLAQAIAARTPIAKLHVVTRGAVRLASERIDPAMTALWGLARVIARENPGLAGCTLDGGADLTADALWQVLTSNDGETEAAWREGVWHVPRLRQGIAAGAAAWQPSPEGTDLISGGLGALGLRTARRLVERGARHLLLLSRHGLDSGANGDLRTEERRRAVEELQACGATVKIAAVDVADRQALAALLSQVDPARPLRGVFHAAGLLEDGVLHNQNSARLARAFAAKVWGAQHLDELTRDCVLEQFVLFSSAAAVLGSAGQGPYAAANAFLDGLAHRRQSQGLPAATINWGPWAEAGMAATGEQRRWSQSGVQHLSTAAALDAFERIMASQRVQTLVIRAHWPQLAGAAGPAPLFSELVEHSAPLLTWPQRLQQLPNGQHAGLIAKEVRATVAAVLGLRAEEVPTDTGFFDLGLDSLMTLDLRNRLQRQVGDAPVLSSTLVLDHPTLTRLTGHLTQLLLHENSVPSSAGVRGRALAESIAIIGVAARFPGAVDADAFWKLLHSGADAITEAPRQRWDWQVFRDDHGHADARLRWAGLLTEVDGFDASFFGITPREAVAIDPQHRLVLETAWEALEDAALAPATLLGSDTGVFLGLSTNDYAAQAAAGSSPWEGYFAIGNALSAAAGRLAYTLGLQGPALVVDTACSSSLVAIHQACGSLQAGECGLALAGGVNLILNPLLTRTLSQAGMLAGDGRCKTFAADADGYVRGEGCGIVVLKRLNDALRDGDQILAVIRGSAVNQDGRSGGLTVPNGPAQEAVIRAALSAAAVAPHEIDYVEAHGTGTSLGDPIEAQALAAALGAGRSADRPLLMGSVKTNIGHLESAAGIAGLIKVVLALRHEEIPQHLHFTTPSPHIPWSTLPVQVTGTALPWPRDAARRRLAGISSFGFVGTNAHLIVEEAPVQPAKVADGSPTSHYLLTLSAKSPQALRELARRHARWLSEHPQAELADVALTTGVGRNHLAHRAALVVESVTEARTLLSALEKDSPAPGLYSRVRSTPRIAWLFTGHGALPRECLEYLYRAHRRFRATLDDCAVALAKTNGQPSALSSWEDLTLAQRWFAAQVAVARMWLHWGMKPELILGDGTGEIAAGCVNGQFSLAEGLALLEAQPASIEPHPSQWATLDNRTGALVETGQVLSLPTAHPLTVERALELLAAKGCTLLGLVGSAALALPEEIAHLDLMGDSRSESDALAQWYTAGGQLNFIA